MKKRRLCVNDADFKRTIVFNRDLEVWIGGELDHVGKIESFTEDTVKIEGGSYLRMNCQFVMV